ncbi:phage major capsid protein [Aliivibrio sp. EL58]|uniref:phage major capsid protein n=1 Tax=Aliivibrio sp. EL58 TaxID=2107582 RepID=UPI000EFA9E39|nr:phage major capsid protein [Aliivibrio sp. EL58]
MDIKQLIKKQTDFNNNLETTITDLNDKIDAIQYKADKKELRESRATVEKQDPREPKTKNFLIKDFTNSGQKDYAQFKAQVKGLPLDGNTALYEETLNVEVLEQAIQNNAVLNAIGQRATTNLTYRRTVLTQRPQILLTKENTTFTAVSETDATNYSSISGLFTKAFAFPRLTNEVLEQSDADVESNLLKLLSEQFAITMQDQILHGDGTETAGVQQLKGICNAAIDRANAYAEALKPSATRARDILAAVKANAADIGTTAAEIEAFLYTLMLTVPERSQATSQFAMNENTLSFLMQNLKDTQGRSLINLEMIKDNGVWVRRINLFGATIILNETIDDIGAGNAPIIFGDFTAAYEMLKPSQGDHFLVDQYTIPDTVGYYQDMYFGSVVADHEALAVLVCVA